MKKITRSQIDPDNIPRHVAIIMDGNGRWAEKRSLPRSMGHRRGAEILEPVIDAAMDLGIDILSFYALSVENIQERPRDEIGGLWMLLEYFFKINFQKMCDRNIRIIHSGSLKGIPASTASVLKETVEKTARHKAMTVNFCINYGGRQEIVQGVNTWLKLRGADELLTEKKLQRHMSSGQVPDVDLLIRTSGEYRLSNFLLWQMAYAELYFPSVLWPDFKAAHLYQAVYEYQKRERRFGGI